MDEELDRTEEHEGPRTPTSLSFLNVKNRLIRFEGWARHIYMDSEGYFTIGVGFLLPDKYALGKYRWREKKSKKVVIDKRLIETDWDAVKKKGKGHKLPAYAAVTNFEISDSDIARLLNVKMYQFHQETRRVFKDQGIDFDALPPLVKEALFDITWTTGPGDFRHDWPKLKAAIRKRDWAEAAAESHRIGGQVGPKRNQEIKNLFWQQVFFEEQESGPASLSLTENGVVE